jgi:hypothetical protein
MHTMAMAIVDGALQIADTLDDWLTEAVRGFGAAAPVATDPLTTEYVDNAGRSR